VGVFDGNGASPVCVIETLEALKIDSGICPRAISAVDVMKGELDNLDVIIFPGGSGSQELNNLGTLGADKVRAFGKQKNKGVVGICAGGYLLSSTVGYPNLRMVPIIHIRDHYDRGRGLICFSQTKVGDEVFPENKTFKNLYYQYYDGPVYESLSDTSSIVVYARINTDISVKEGDPKGVSPGKPAILSYNYGQGKIFISIGHPEATHGMRWLVPRLARLAANKPIISYDPRLVKPDSYAKELLFNSDLITYEKNLFWKLADENSDTIIQALNRLEELHSRPSIRWAIGLLRHHDARIRLKAADYLVFTEYTYALPDLAQAIADEKDPQTLNKMKAYYKQLKEYINE
jgi:glutamine amidotransferase-like uncharacterized protein